MVTVIEQIKEFINQTNQSSKRSRRLVFFISFSSIVSFMLLCSSSHKSWSRLRYQKALEIERAIDTNQSKLQDRIVFKEQAVDSLKHKAFIESRKALFSKTVDRYCRSAIFKLKTLIGNGSLSNFSSC